MRSGGSLFSFLAHNDDNNKHGWLFRNEFLLAIFGQKTAFDWCRVEASKISIQ